jgi:hypothetical protein
LFAGVPAGVSASEASGRAGEREKEERRGRSGGARDVGIGRKLTDPLNE